MASFSLPFWKDKSTEKQKLVKVNEIVSNSQSAEVL